MNSTKYDVICIGNPFFDRFVYVDDNFLKENKITKDDTTQIAKRIDLDKFWEKCPISKERREGISGGAGTNVIKVLSRLGNKCALAGMIGSDACGEELKTRLNDIGIKLLMIRGASGNGVVNCFVTPDSKRTMQTFLGSADELKEEHISKKVFEKVKHVHLEGYLAYSGNVLEKCIELAKAENATISLDLGSRSLMTSHAQKFRDLVKKVDYIFGNELEFLTLHPGKTLQAAVESFDHHQTVVATRDEKGCMVKEKNAVNAQEFSAKEVPSTDIKDTTGAGDYFAGGFLHGILNKQSIEKCVEIANLAATYVIRQLGADLEDYLWRDLKKEVDKITN